ncbi:uncharacterized protein LOC105702518 [Orussus abietinus]|uniref:uncharacterized protein LOC105702518 n=1 Tax=Orussus abietinus TaxID=222816 RepID=UPI000C715AE6|nr:uncharacterized protein LOC105702518 [Orussus abietinus]
MRLLLGILVLVGLALARPATYDEYLVLADDVATVGSLRREVREPAPSGGVATEVRDLLEAGAAPKKKMKNASGKVKEGGYYKTYGNDADGEKGFIKRTYSKGDHGYKTLDTFHKQDGDKYLFAKETAYGKGRDSHHGDKHAKSGSYKDGDDGKDHEGAGNTDFINIIINKHLLNDKQ